MPRLDGCREAEEVVGQINDVRVSVRSGRFPAIHKKTQDGLCIRDFDLAASKEVWRTL
jgi:hypothetical protein